MRVFESEFVVRAPLAAVWAFHADPLALPKVMTGPVRMHVHSVDQPIKPGSQIRMTMRIGPFSVPWVVCVRERIDGRMFTDEQVGTQGPFKHWVHTHSFEAIDARSALIKDRIEYEPPFGMLGRIADALFGRIAMQLMFIGRRAATRKLLES
jgi:ligand-binding SRPBCC domain-containing protein